MDYEFNANELFKMAEQLEKDGVEFYTGAAKTARDDETKKLFLHLAGMEEDHVKTFSDLRASLVEKEKWAETFDPQDEAVLYLKALVDLQVFFRRELPEDATLNEILENAVDAEKDSITFYLGMIELMPDSADKAIIDIIIKEEMSHIELLGTLL